MTERRISIPKLSKYLRILEDDLIDLLVKAGLEQSPNSKGFIGYKLDEVKQYIASLNENEKFDLYALKLKWEAVNLRYDNSNEDFFSVNEVSDFLNIEAKHVNKFLTTHNVPKTIRNGHPFWNVTDILRIQTRPTKKQSTDLNRLRKTKTAAQHLKGQALADLLGVPVELVNKYKKLLRIEKVYPLTREYVLDLISEPNFDSRRDRFLARQEKKEKQSRGVQKQTSKKERLFSSPKAAELLGITPERFRRVSKKLGYKPDSSYTNRYKQEIALYNHSTIMEMTEKEEFFAPRTDPFYNHEKEVEEITQRITATVKDAVQVNVPKRVKNPYFATLYVGPTNSGKTYNALNALYEEYESDPEGTFVYAAPLRMLAFEVYQKMVARYGRSEVGFITGEESINPTAPLLATTVEMAPTAGTSLVLDEAHWIIEPGRGHKWTRLLTGGEYQSLHILTATEGQPTICELVDDSYDVQVKLFERKTPVVFRGDVNIADLPDRTVVVCFSRKSVYKTAQTLIAKSDKKVGVLYGALPLVAREQQINDFISGKTNIIVTTDVIGHGINLPVDNVVFVETDKFDGDSTRELYLWEAAQIAGRAGRYGLSDQGNIYTLRFDWNDVNKSLVEAATKAAAGIIGTNLSVNKALVAPAFTDLNTSNPDMIMLSLEEWSKKLASSEEGYKFNASSMREPKARLETLAKHLKTPVYPWDNVNDMRDYVNSYKFGQGKPFYGTDSKATKKWNLTAEELWNVISGPFESTLPTIKVLGDWLQSGKNPKVLEDFFQKHFGTIMTEPHSIEEWETLARIVAELKMISIIFNNPEGLFHLELEHVEEIIGQNIIRKVLDELNNQHGNVCVECGRERAPWYSYCDECYRKPLVGLKHQTRVA